MHRFHGVEGIDMVGDGVDDPPSLFRLRRGGPRRRFWRPQNAGRRGWRIEARREGRTEHVGELRRLLCAEHVGKRWRLDLRLNLARRAWLPKLAGSQRSVVERSPRRFVRKGPPPAASPE